MTVKVITDTGSDITPEEAKRLGITLIPLYLRFGNEVYRDGVDINADEFYRKLKTTSVHPFTSSPSPGDFAKVYNRVAQETDEIVSIHITSKHSFTYNAALLGKEIAEGENKGCRIEVIDSRGVTMWQGFAAIAAAKAAEARCNLNQVVEKVNETINQTRAMGLLNTLSYVVKGGRLGKAIARMESLLNIKPLLILRAGEIHPSGFVRTRNKGMERLREFIKSALNIQDLAIVHSVVPEEAKSLAEYASSLFPHIIPRIGNLGPAIGVHGGPGAIIAVIEETQPVPSENNNKLRK